MGELTEILLRADSGDPTETDKVWPLVYQELRQLAHRKLAHEAPGQTLETTDLVHEAYLRLVGPNQAWTGRRHFFSAAAEAMRRILIERARRRHSVKHGGQYQRVDLNEKTLSGHSGQLSDENMLVVDDLLEGLSDAHPQEAEITKLHLFAGFSIRECAKALEIPSSSAHDRWRFARAWLAARMIDRDSAE